MDLFPNGSIDDGHGNVWPLCKRPGCALEIVRPGKVQCYFCDAEPVTVTVDMDEVKVIEKWREGEVKEFTCPTCGAFPGTRCRIGGTGSIVSHQDRYLIAAAAGAVPPLAGFDGFNGKGLSLP